VQDATVPFVTFRRFYTTKTRFYPVDLPLVKLICVLISTWAGPREKNSALHCYFRIGRGVVKRNFSLFFTFFSLNFAKIYDPQFFFSNCTSSAVGVRDGYPWVPTDQAHSRPRQVGPAHQKTRRPVSRLAQPDMWARRQEDSLA
jgi:hypothetical protein